MPSYQIQHLNVNVLLSMFLKYKISIHYIYIYWCVNINIYICTLIHAHIYETVRALFRGFGRLSPLNS